MYVRPEDMKDSLEKITDGRERAKQDIVSKLKSDPELFKRAVDIMNSDNPGENYAKNLFGKQFSEAVGHIVNNILFVELMSEALGWDYEKIRQLRRQAAQYQMNNPAKYNKEGFGRDISCSH